MRMNVTVKTPTGRATGRDVTGAGTGALRLESWWATVGGVRMHARVRAAPGATGPPVVLVHGLGVSSRSLAPTAALLAPDHPVFAPDLPGFGRSERPRRALDVAGLAAALCDWLDAAGLDRVVLLGNSLGCQTVAELAAAHPERVQRAVLVGPTMDPTCRTALHGVWRVLHATPHECLSQPFLVALDCAVAGLPRCYRTFRHACRHPLSARLRQVAAPTLVVRGAGDAVAPQRWAEEVARLLPRGRLVVVPGAGHTVNYSAPRELVRLIGPFLAGV
jgi:2-hydroxy-6-oxonona-2,4-dienedioate hydrolase